MVGLGSWGWLQEQRALASKLLRLWKEVGVADYEVRWCKEQMRDLEQADRDDERLRYLLLGRGLALSHPATPWHHPLSLERDHVCRPYGSRGHATWLHRW